MYTNGRCAKKKDEIFFFSKASATANFVQLTRWGGCVGGDSQRGMETKTNTTLKKKKLTIAGVSNEKGLTMMSCGGMSSNPDLIDEKS